MDNLASLRFQGLEEEEEETASSGYREGHCAQFSVAYDLLIVPQSTGLAGSVFTVALCAFLLPLRNHTPCSDSDDTSDDDDEEDDTYDDSNTSEES